MSSFVPSSPSSPLVWDRPEPGRRPAPGPLSREKIVRAAIALADRDGIDAVSLRNVAAKLKVGPMRLYAYTATKDGLLALMVDDVYREMLEASDDMRGGWREALRAIAHGVRRASKQHPWFIGLLGGRPHIGPNALAHMEMSMAAVSRARSFPSIDDVMRAVGIVLAYTVGAIHAETHELQEEEESGLDKEAWRRAQWPYLERMLATGSYPTLSRVVHESKPPSFEERFAFGLDCVLDGIAARLTR